MWRSLRLRLLLGTILVVVLAVGVTAFVASQRTAGEFQRYVEHGGSLRGRRFSGYVARSYTANQGWNGIQSLVEQLEQVGGQRVVVANAQGRIVGDSERNLVGRSASNSWLATPIVIPGGIRVGSLYLDPVAGPNPADLAFVTAVNRSLLFGALVAGLAGLVVTLVLSSRILQPVERLTAAAQRMEKGDLTARVPVESEDEIGKLAHAFNAMAGSLAQQEQLRRNMVSDVAHELRTPLTNLRGYLQAARDGLLAPDEGLLNSLYEESMLLSRLVNDLQELAQAEAGQLRLVSAWVTLGSIVDQAVGMLKPQAEAKGLSLCTEVPPNLPQVYVDPERVGQVLRNLLNNAMAHTPAGGAITVSVAACDHEVVVTVRDTGSGIPAEDLPFVFDRFYRVDKSRNRQTGGAGLGLAIVKQLVGALGGTIAVDSQVNRGTTFTFTLPAVGPA